MLRPQLAAGERFARSSSCFRDRRVTGYTTPQKVEPSSGAAPESSRYECEVLLVELRRQEMVRQAGYAPASAVWKTAVLLLNDCRF